MNVQSNKNTNKYIIKQSYIDKNNNFQEVLEPTNISGVKIEYKDNKLFNTWCIDSFFLKC